MELPSIILAILSVALAYLALRVAAKPRLGITLLDHGHLVAGEETIFDLEVRNRRSLYGRAMATDVRVYVNVDRAVELIKLHYGAGLQLADEEVKIGKNDGRYLKAQGITLLPRQSEILRFRAKLPGQAGKYRIWIDTRSAEGGYSTLRACLDVRG